MLWRFFAKIKTLLDKTHHNLMMSFVEQCRKQNRRRQRIRCLRHIVWWMISCLLYKKEKTLTQSKLSMVHDEYW